jgi:U3 small nucleolar RNA-associated protein 4
MSAQDPGAVLKLQRIRFYDHTPSPISAIAFAPLPLPPAASLQTPGQASVSSTNKGKGTQAPDELGVLVVAKQNGEVDIWEYLEPERSENGEESRGGWVLEKVG